MQPRLPSLLILAFASCATLALPRAGVRNLPPVTTRAALFRLPSGVQVIINQTPGMPLVSVATLVKGGSSADPLDQEGLSNLVGQLTLRSRDAAGLTRQRAFEQAGVAETSVRSTLDATIFETTAPKSTLAQWLPLELDRIANPLAAVDEATFEVTRKQVRNELRERCEMVEGADFGWLQEAAFPPGHPYHRPVLGSHQSLNRLTLAAAQAFALASFRPNNVTMSISGDLSEATLAALNLSPQPAEAVLEDANVPVSMPEAPATRLSEHTAQVATPRLYLVWSLPPGYGRTDEVVRRISARAAERLQDTWHYDEDVMKVAARTVRGAQASLLVVTVDLYRGTHPAQTMEHVLNYVFGLSAPINEGASLYVRDSDTRKENYNRALQALYDLEEMSARSEQSVTEWAFANRLDPLAARTAQSLSLDPRELEQFSREWVTRERARGVLVWPVPDNAAGPVSSRSSLRATQPLPDFAPQPLERAETEGTKAQTFTLTNGLKVLVVPKPGWPTVGVSLAIPGGAITGPLGAAALAHDYAAPRLVTYGTPANYGLVFERAYEQDLQRLTALGKAENLPNILAQFSTSLSSLHIDSQLQVSLDRYWWPYKRELDELPQRKAERELARALFPSSALGALPVTSDLQRLTPSTAANWANDVSPRGAVLTIVGDVSTSEAVRAAQEWLATWSGEASAPIDEAPKPAPQTLSLVRPAAPQTQLMFACRVDSATPAQRAANLVLAEAWEQATTDHLRDQLGASTGFDGRFAHYRGGNGFISLGGSVDNAATDEAVQAARASLDKVETLSPASFERARWAALRKQALLKRDSATWATTLATRLARGETLAESEAPSASFAALTAEQLAAAAQSCAHALLTQVVADPSTLKRVASTTP